jgi:hypothetical protein
MAKQDVDEWIDSIVQGAEAYHSNPFEDAREGEKIITISVEELRHVILRQCEAISFHID